MSLFSEYVFVVMSSFHCVYPTKVDNSETTMKIPFPIPICVRLSLQSSKVSDDKERASTNRVVFASMNIAPPYPDCDTQDAKERLDNVSLVLDERDLNSNTPPFPLCLHIPLNVFVPERVSELDETEMRGVSFVEAEDREVMFISLNVSEPVATLTREHPLSNGAFMRMSNALRVKYA